MHGRPSFVAEYECHLALGASLVLVFGLAVIRLSVVGAVPMQKLRYHAYHAMETQRSYLLVHIDILPSSFVGERQLVWGNSNNLAIFLVPVSCSICLKSSECYVVIVKS